jgi:RimJ/RimL family protein N-acetyltransferase
MQLADYDDVMSLYQNEHVRRFLGGTLTDAQFRPRFEKLCNQASEGEYYWVIRHSYDQAFMGLISIDPHHDGDAFELSYQLLPQWWGSGYADEVSRLFLHYAFTELGLPKIVAETQAANAASRRLLEKLGMKITSTVERFGECQYIYSLSRDTMTEYYSLRAAEYEKIYNREDPVRQAEQQAITEAMRQTFKDKTVLEVACGTGYWTERYADVAKHVTATDLTVETLEIAMGKSIPNTDFQICDAYDLSGIAGEIDYDAACANFWFSHIPKARTREFLTGLHSKLSKGAVVFMADNVYVEGIGGSLVSHDGDSDTYKLRELDNGTTFEILKNYYSEFELQEIVDEYDDNLEIHIGECFWWVRYQVK